MKAHGNVVVKYEKIELNIEINTVYLDIFGTFRINK